MSASKDNIYYTRSTIEYREVWYVEMPEICTWWRLIDKIKGCSMTNWHWSHLSKSRTGFCCVVDQLWCVVDDDTRRRGGGTSFVAPGIMCQLCGFIIKWIRSSLRVRKTTRLLPSAMMWLCTFIVGTNERESSQSL